MLHLNGIYHMNGIIYD